MTNQSGSNSGSTLLLPEIEGLATEQPALYEALRKLRNAVVSLQSVVKQGSIAPEGNVTGVPGCVYVQHSPKANAPIGLWFKTTNAGPTGWVQFVAAPAGVNSSTSVKTTAGPQSTIIGEVPTGARNGTNQTFTLAHTPNPASSVQVFVNSVRYYQFTVNNNTITLNFAPTSSDTVTVNYTY